MCEFCEKKEIERYENASFFINDDNDLEIEIVGNCYAEKGLLGINYCPECGRKLSDKDD